MTNIDLSIEQVYGPRPHLNHKVGLTERIIFVGLLVAGLLFAGFNLVNDINVSGDIAITWLPYILLGIALLIALGLNLLMDFMTRQMQ